MDRQEQVNLSDFETVAKTLLPREVYDNIAGGATDEISVERNRRGFASWALRPRVLLNALGVDLSTSVLATEVQLPILIAPCGGHKKVHREGEPATYRAATAAGTVMIASANASTSFEELAGAAAGHLWLQLYPFKDRVMTKTWLHRAAAAGYEAICVTLDSNWPSKRERDIRNGYVALGGINYGSERPRTRGAWVNPAATWADLEWIRSQTQLPIVAKGIMTGEDAKQCVEVGVDAIVVSNHGGRHLDNTLATIEVLPEAVDAVSGQLEVMLDGGVRRGADVVKALALGAKAVLIGRPLFWGLAVNGEDGVIRILDILREEMEITMAKCGRPTIASIDGTTVVKAPTL